MNPNTILVTDDERAAVENVGLYLTANGFSVLKAYDGEEALDIARREHPALVLLDIGMPRKKGTDALREIKAELPEAQVIMLTSIGDIGVAMHCIQNGAYSFIQKPVDLELMLMEIRKAQRHFDMERSVRSYKKNLEELVDARNRAIDALQAKIHHNYLYSMRIMASLLESGNGPAGGHLKRVANYSRKVAELLVLPPTRLDDIELAALLHDIGTLAMPAKLMSASYSDCTREEARIIQRHPVFTQTIIAPLEELAPVGKIIRSHLELLDGSGFPDGLAGEQIPLESRILGVANAFDELTTRRRFSKEALSAGEQEEAFAFDYLFANADKHYQHSIIQLLQQVVKKLKESRRTTRTLPVHEVKAGMALMKDVLTLEGLPVMLQGKVLAEDHVAQLTALKDIGLIQDQLTVCDAI